MKLHFIVGLAIISSCAQNNNVRSSKKALTRPNAPIAVSNRELWLGRSGDELLLHPIYASLPLESRKTSTGITVMSFKNSGGHVSNQTCSISNYYTPSLNSGSGSGYCSDSRVEISCNHIFYVNKNLITDYKRVGQCYGDRFDFRPHDNDGNPVVTDSEKKYIQELTAYNEVMAGKDPCNSTSECSDGMSCKDNKCESLGLWGRLFNP